MGSTPEVKTPLTPDEPDEVGAGDGVDGWSGVSYFCKEVVPILQSTSRVYSGIDVIQNVYR